MLKRVWARECTQCVESFFSLILLGTNLSPPSQMCRKSDFLSPFLVLSLISTLSRQFIGELRSINLIGAFPQNNFLVAEGLRRALVAVGG